MRRRWDYSMLGRLSVSILEEGGRLGLKCLLLSYFRVGDYTPRSSNHASVTGMIAGVDLRFVSSLSRCHPVSKSF
jgi:hypothetical protein